MKFFEKLSGVVFLIATACTPGIASNPTLNGKTIEETFESERLVSLAQAACDGDAEKVQEIASSGVKVDGRGYHGATPLKWALICNSLEGMEALLDAGADPNLRGVEKLGGYATIVVAARQRDSAYLRLLLENGADPNWKHRDGDTILHTAFNHSWLDRPTYWGNYYTLLEFGADINTPGRLNEGIAFLAVAPDTIDKVIEMLELGYTYNLDGVAFHCYTSTTSIDNFDEKYERQVAQLASMLRERGVNLEAAKARAVGFNTELGKRYTFEWERFLPDE